MQGHKCAYRLALMSTLKERIKNARAHARLTQAELAKKVGVSQPVISQLEKGENLQSVHLVKIASICGVSAAWLAEGGGEMLSGGAAEAVVAMPGETSADIVRKMIEKNGKGLSAETRQKIISAVESGSDETAKKSTVVDVDFSGAKAKAGEIRIPQYDVRGSMGHGQLPADYVETIRNVTIDEAHLREKGVTYTNASALAMITGWGQSMAGTINDKDPLIVDRGVREFTEDGVYVLTWHGLLYIKRLQVADADHFELISDNPKHKDRVVPMDEVTIHAKVLLVWSAQKL